jgi:hypothetical protein
LKGWQAWVASEGQVGKNVRELELVLTGRQGTNFGGDLGNCCCWGLGRGGRRKTIQLTHDE